MTAVVTPSASIAHSQSVAGRVAAAAASSLFCVAAYVFEDSFNGLKAGMASEATVIGLATTNPREAIAPLCHCVLDDFTGFTYDKMLQVHK